LIVSDCEKIGALKKEPIFVRPLTAQKQTELRAGRQVRQAFMLRRGQILLCRAAGQTPRQIARQLGGSDQPASCWITSDGQPEVLAHNERGAAVANYVEQITCKAELKTEFQWEGHRVMLVR
jgi:hypothetical protein